MRVIRSTVVFLGGVGLVVAATVLGACSETDEPFGDDRETLVIPTLPTISRSNGAAVFCWVDRDGELHCWPEALEQRDGFPTGRFAWVSVGDDHLCAVREDLRAVCFGFGPCEYGECDAPSGQFVYIRSGLDVNCGERTDGTVYCWGLEEAL